MQACKVVIPLQTFSHHDEHDVATVSDRSCYPEHYVLDSSAYVTVSVFVADLHIPFMISCVFG